MDRRRSKTTLGPNRGEVASKTANSTSRADKPALRNRQKPASRKKISSAPSEVLGSDLRSGLAYVERDLVVKGPEILGNLWDKAGRCGRVEVMREVLYDMISALLGRCAREGPSSTLSHRTSCMVVRRVTCYLFPD